MRPTVIGMLLSAIAVESSPSRIRSGTIDCIAGPPTTKPKPTSNDPTSTGIATEMPCSPGSAKSHTAAKPDPATHSTLPSRICRAGSPVSAHFPLSGSEAAAVRTARHRPVRPSAPTVSRRTSRWPRRCRVSTRRRPRTSCPRTVPRTPGRTSARGRRAAAAGRWPPRSSAGRLFESFGQPVQQGHQRVDVRVGPVGDRLGDHFAPTIRHRGERLAADVG